MIIAEPGYLRGARELSREYAIPMIADEVFVGFGRTGRMFACEHEGVSPDILCLAKGLTGGTLPLAATLATDEIYRAFLGEDRTRCTFFHGHSYTANPLGCAAALASLDLFEKDGALVHVQALEKVLEKEAGRFRELAHAIGVRFKGLVFALDLVRGKEPVRRYQPSECMGEKVCDAAGKAGLLIRPLGDVVYLVPPLVTTERQLREMLAILHDSIVEVTG
jgi:adenosylmethionine-8-amino-7-oxononanoate aminotransferase